MKFAREKSICIVWGTDKTDVTPVPVSQYLYPFVPTVMGGGFMNTFIFFSIVP